MSDRASDLAQGSDDALIGGFLDMMRAERGASRNTIAAYGSDLREIAQFISGQQSSFLTCGRRGLEAFFISRAGAGLASNSASRKLSFLKRFIGFLEADRKRGDHPSQPIDGSKGKRCLPF